MKPVDAALLIFTLLLVWSFICAHRDPNFKLDLFDLVMENGRLSRTAFAFMVTLLVTSWVMIYLTLDGSLTDILFSAYLAAWVAPIVARMFSTPPPPGTVTNTSITTSTVEPREPV